MKKLLIAAMVGSLMMVGTAMAQEARQNTGCGLGTMLWEGQADGSVLSQAMQATTNGTFGTQTFGISSGTSECTQPANIAATERLMEFTAANMDSLARDIASGQGESLTTLAELMEIPQDQRSAFYANLQGNFGNIFVTGNEDAGIFLDRVALATF